MSFITTPSCFHATEQVTVTTAAAAAYCNLLACAREGAGGKLFPVRCTLRSNHTLGTASRNTDYVQYLKPRKTLLDCLCPIAVVVVGYFHWPR